MTDTMPGTVPTIGPALPPDLTPPPPPEPDAKPKRPTTRAGRAAASAAAKAKRSSKPDSTPKTSKPRKASLETRLTGNLVTIGTMVAAAGGMASPAVSADGVLIVQHAPHIAAALDKVAKDDPRVAAALERMLTVGTWSGLIAALLPLILGIAANHGAIPPQIAALLGADPAQAPAPATPEPVTFGGIA